MDSLMDMVSISFQTGIFTEVSGKMENLVDKENIFIVMEVAMKEIFGMIFRMEKAKKFGTMDLVTMDNIDVERKMVGDDMFFLQGAVMKENLEKINSMVGENTFGTMRDNTKANSIEISLKEKVCTNGLMVDIIEDII
jgi:hypothetical protein